MRLALLATIAAFVAGPSFAFDPAQSLGKCAEYMDSLPSIAQSGLETECPSQLLKVCAIQLEDKAACFDDLRTAVVEDTSAILGDLPSTLPTDTGDSQRAKVEARMFNRMRESPVVFECDERARAMFEADPIMIDVAGAVEDACAFASETLLWYSAREARRHFHKYEASK